VCFSLPGFWLSFHSHFDLLRLLIFSIFCCLFPTFLKVPWPNPRVFARQTAFFFSFVVFPPPPLAPQITLTDKYLCFTAADSPPILPSPALTCHGRPSPVFFIFFITLTVEVQSGNCFHFFSKHLSPDGKTLGP